MSWSKKYKKSIDCSNPKGFSQKAHCAGRKKRNETKKTINTEMKLKNYMPKGFELGKVYSNPYATAFQPQENIQEETIKEDDHEVGMGLSSLKSSVRSAKTIYDNIKKRDIEELDGWVQEKLTLAADYLKNVADYMEDLEEYDKDGESN